MQNASTVSQDSDIKHEPPEFSGETEIVVETVSNTNGLEERLQYNLAAFFLNMQTLLHVSQRATQEIMEHIVQSCLHWQNLLSETL